jgi:hypothetical protein
LLRILRKKTLFRGDILGKIHFLISYTPLFCIFAILTFATTGCKSFSKIGSNNFQIVDFTEDDFKQLNGTYSNSFDTIVGTINDSSYDGLGDKPRVDVLSQLLKNFPETARRDENGKMINPKEKWIKIEFISKKQATINMYHNDKFVFSKTILGKFKNGYFYPRPKILVIPLFPLVFGYNFERARIGKTTEDDLIIDYTVNMLGFAWVAGSVKKGATSSIYKKKKEEKEE